MLKETLFLKRRSNMGIVSSPYKIFQHGIISVLHNANNFGAADDFVWQVWDMNENMFAPLRGDEEVAGSIFGIKNGTDLFIASDLYRLQTGEKIVPLQFRIDAQHHLIADHGD